MENRKGLGGRSILSGLVRIIGDEITKLGQVYETLEITVKTFYFKHHRTRGKVGSRGMT